MKYVFLVFCLLLISIYLSAQVDAWYSPANSADIAHPYIDVSTAFQVNDPEFIAETLSRAWLSGETFLFTLPDQQGDAIQVSLTASVVMHPGLSARYPGILPFRGFVSDRPETMVRLELTMHGLSAAIFDEAGQMVYQPVTGSHDKFIHYIKGDAAPLRTSTFSCGVTEVADPSPMASFQRTADSLSLRKYRLAVAATGEYTQFHGGTVEAGLAAVVVTVNRMTGIYERDFGVSFELIENNDTLIYTDPFTDPYNNNSPNQMINQNQSNLNDVIGMANYDVGHVLGTAGGGLAGLGVVCNHNSKARGMTGLSSPVGDPFDVDYVSHEVGHQFRGNHTFNFCNGSSGPVPFEPGSGSTIMAYAGLCGINNVQTFSDDYFNAGTLNEVYNFIHTGTGSFCPQMINTGNFAPEVEILSITPIAIPMSTPFKLEAHATDPNDDAITYCWEQIDSGPAAPMNNPAGNSPLFRTRNPTASPVRYFPQLSTVINGTFDLREQLPTYARSMTFRVTARDNNPETGSYDYKVISFVVDDNAGPFRVTYPTASDDVMFAGVPQTVTWDAANTDEFPTSCHAVHILLSLDGGWTWPVELADEVPNTGEAQVILPEEFVSTARIKVKAADNIFYNISEANFTIEEYTSSQNLIEHQVSILPNPAGNYVRITGLEHHNADHITVFDMKGRLVQSLAIDQHVVTPELNVASLSAGLYMIVIQTGHGLICERFVKK